MGIVRRFLVDWSGNYIFFVCLVLIFNIWNWDKTAIITYLLSSILIAGIGGRGFILFLKYIWYPIWRIKYF